MPGVAPISYSDTGNWSIKPVLLTMAGKTWLKMGHLVTDSAAPVFSPQDGDIRMNSFPWVCSSPGISITKNKDWWCSEMQIS